MQFTFLDMAGKTLFVRDDAERASWTQEEMSLDLEFPMVEGKVVSIGQRVFFKDPSTGSHQIYEIKQAKTVEPDHLQEIVAENICISELSDEHINNLEITGKTAKQALTSVLAGTLWEVGSVYGSPVSSVNVSRGSVWQAVLEITDNWNVYIEPRVTLASNGTITRKLDIVNPAGVFNGVRLSVNKNMLDPSVTYDDSEVVTAMYGYGGTITSSDPSEKNTECTFKDVVWSRTNSHPAKPKGQEYIEYPAATAQYGRNGRPRYGFYQNTDITDPDTLLQKTWESLQTACKPSVSIEGTVADLYRMGYADQPIKLHDIAIVEIDPAGFKAQIQIIRMATDLLDPSATTLTIGSYIPNIIYIERKTNESATGSRGGGGGNSNEEDNSWHQFRTTIEQINDGTALRFQSVQNDITNQEKEIAYQTGRIDIAYDKITIEATERQKGDNTLSGRITVTAREIRQEVTDTANGLQSQITQNADQIKLKVNKGDVASTINLTPQSALIKASRINLEGYVTASELEATNAHINNLQSGSTAFVTMKAGSVQTGTLRVNGTMYVKKETLIPDVGWIHYLGY